MEEPRRVLLATRHFAEPPCDGAGLRTAALRCALNRSGATVRVFSAAPFRAPTPTGGWLRDPVGLPSDEDWTDAAQRALAAEISDLDPHVVILTGLQAVPALVTVRRHPCHVVLDAHNVEGALAREILEHAPAPVSPLARTVANRTARRETLALAAVDAVWACSELDRQQLTTLTRTPVEVVPNAVTVPDGAVVASRKGGMVLFTGAMSYPPNREAVSRLLEILPLLREGHPTARLTIAGVAPSKDLRVAAEVMPWLEVTGGRASFADLFSGARALAVPLYAGSGTRLKILEAFAAGLPVVSTAKGVEGLDVTPGRHFLTAETVSDFVDALGQVFAEPDLGTALARGALAFVRDRHSVETLVPIVEGLVP